MWVWGRIRRKQKMGWDKQADTADATSGKLDPAGPLVVLMASCKPVILRLCVINKWIPAPEVSVYQPGKWEHSGFWNSCSKYFLFGSRMIFLLNSSSVITTPAVTLFITVKAWPWSLIHQAPWSSLLKSIFGNDLFETGTLAFSSNNNSNTIANIDWAHTLCEEHTMG